MEASLSERIFRGSVLFAVAAVPCAVLPGWPDAYLAPKLALAAAASLTAAAALAVSGRIRDASSRMDLPVCASAAAWLLCTLASMDPLLSWFGMEQRYLFGMTGVAAAASAFYLGCALRRGSGAVLRPSGGSGTHVLRPSEVGRDVSRSLCIGACAVAAVALIDRFFPGFWRDGDVSLPSSMAGNYDSTALFLGMALPAAWDLCLSPGLDRRLGTGAFILAACALGATGSRSAVLAVAASWPVYAWMRHGGDKKPLPGRMRLLLWAGGGAALAFLTGSLLLRAARTSLLYGGFRSSVWRIAWGVFADQPLLGSGPGTFGIGYLARRGLPLAPFYYENAHNDWLEVLATTGLTGIAAYAWLHAAAWSILAALRRRGDGRTLAPMVAGVCVFLLYAKLNPPNIGLAWVAAVMAGGVLGGGPGARFRPGPVLLAASAAFLCFFSVRMLAGDLQYRSAFQAGWSGRMADADAHFRRALAWRPESVVYRVDRVNMLWHASEHADSPEARSALLDLAAESALDGIRRRPLEVSFHYLLARAELRRGRLDAARAGFETVLRLDPRHRGAEQGLEGISGSSGPARP